MKIQKKNRGGCRGGRVGGIRVDVIEELKFLLKLKKSCGGRFGWGGGVQLGGGGQSECE